MYMQLSLFYAGLFWTPIHEDLNEGAPGLFAPYVVFLLFSIPPFPERKAPQLITGIWYVAWSKHVWEIRKFWLSWSVVSKNGHKQETFCIFCCLLCESRGNRRSIGEKWMWAWWMKVVCFYFAQGVSRLVEWKELTGIERDLIRTKFSNQLHGIFMTRLIVICQMAGCNVDAEFLSPVSQNQKEMNSLAALMYLKKGTGVQLFRFWEDEKSPCGCSVWVSMLDFEMTAERM